MLFLSLIKHFKNFSLYSSSHLVTLIFHLFVSLCYIVCELNLSFSSLIFFVFVNHLLYLTYYIFQIDVQYISNKVHIFLVYSSLNFNADYTPITITSFWSKYKHTHYISESYLMPLSSQMALPEATIVFISTIYSRMSIDVTMQKLLFCIWLFLLNKVFKIH